MTMPKPQTLSLKNKQVLGDLLQHLHDNQLNYVAIANNLPSQTPPVVRTAVQLCAENNYMAVRVVQHLLNDEQREAENLIFKIEAERRKQRGYED
jgi:hypothetical protein